MQHKCGLAIHDLQENDTGHYYFHFDTDAYGRRSKTSVYLAVTEVRASVHPSSTVRAGWSVRLDCQTSCQNHAIWFKDGEPVTNTEFQAQIGDAGNYTCAIEGDESVQSDPVTLDVQYPTLNLSVELSYSGRLTLGISVNLTCCGAANPAAENYTWYRSTGANGSSMVQVGTGQVLSIPSVEVTHFGRYLCKAQNLFWEISSPEILMEEEAESSDPTLNLSVELSYSGRLTLGISVNLTCCGAANPAAENYTWYRSTGANGSSMVQVGTGQVLSIPSVEATHFGRYLCKAQNLFWEISSPEILMEEEAESSDPTLNLSVELSYSGRLTLGISVNLTCCGAANPAAENYTWYRSTGANGSSMVQVGTGQVLSIPSVEATHFGRYLCKAQNLFWEISSPEILMEEEAESSDPTLNLSVELSYSGRLTLGISVNLTCCGAANPAAENYTWYRSTGANGSSMVQVGTGQVLSIPSVEATHFGRYLCKAQNLFWEISSPEILMEEEAESSDPTLNLSVELSYSGRLTLGISVNLTCCGAANPAAENYTWYRSTGANGSSMVQVGTGQVLSIPSVEATHFGRYLCKAQNLFWEISSPEILMEEEAESSGE
ncbi:hypothetical protein D4764_10G0005890 [Takifugu flavidus]|uniref:Ig-like domain-containing protein n=1 Tax=Takifugu flavidus TaxID=433684 RepID=A0A5C6PKW9_9TELE|nr:hypothetical protein D4764_10G0005890 [Takifugu flavidus]